MILSSAKGQVGFGQWKGRRQGGEGYLNLHGRMTREFILTRVVGGGGPRGDKNDREWRLRNKKPTSVSQCLTGSWRSKAEAKGGGSLAIISTALLAGRHRQLWDGRRQCPGPGVTNGYHLGRRQTQERGTHILTVLYTPTKCCLNSYSSSET